MRALLKTLAAGGLALAFAAASSGCTSREPGAAGATEPQAARSNSFTPPADVAELRRQLATVRVQLRASVGQPSKPDEQQTCAALEDLAEYLLFQDGETELGLDPVVALRVESARASCERDPAASALTIESAEREL